ncbi:unannotated protein [freshwater metagenome]|uniref:Unannotated protein n=1 Tax=freshwater metagenome TaxID=449393 RepID=A0A6J6DTZ2_9ZZZZ|nr:hypothetical protein [Actinomycetota bacterium]
MRRWATVSFMALAMVLSACGKDAASSSSSILESSQSSNSGSSGQESIGVDDFTSPVVGGGSFVLSKALADKPVVLWFWAPG